MSVDDALEYCIEGNPFIIRFKTLLDNPEQYNLLPYQSIEGNPFIIRFKTVKKNSGINY